MRVPVSWIRDFVDLPADADVKAFADRLTMLGLKLEALESAGAEVRGPLVIGRVLGFVEEQHSNGKTIRWCQVDVGEEQPRGVVCGALNFAVNDVVVVALPGTVLPGGFEIGARKTYGHVSDGMICSASELGLGDDHTGILVLQPDEGKPGDSAVDALHLREDVIEFEINPDRAYALSVRGIAREAATACDLPFQDPATSLPAATAGKGFPVLVEDPAGCDVFVALEVTGFDPTRPSPRWLARRVALAGMRPISLAVDVTNYVMLELGNPIHGYDRGALRGPIRVRRARQGETLVTLDGVTRELAEEDLLITDDRGPIGLAGVMGGAATELGQATTDLVIEAAHFDPVTIARAARRHRLPSEASRRFERGVDPTIAAVAARRVADLLVEFGGGEVAATGTVVGVPRERPAIAMASDLPSRVSGVPIDADTSVSALEAIGGTVRSSDRMLEVVAPPWRGDLTDPNDLVEEVLRIVGYDRVPSVLPAAPAGRGLTRNQRLRRRVGIAVATAGYVEVLDYPFVGERDWDALRLLPTDQRRNAVRLANPLSDEEPLLATTLLPGLLRTGARNVGRGQDDVALYEIGRVFLPRPGGPKPAPRLGVEDAPSADDLAALEAALPDQPLHLAVVASGAGRRGGWWGASTAVSWEDAIEACRRAGGAVGVRLEARASAMAPWHPGRCAELRLGALVVGHAGELHPGVCKAFRLPARAVAAELDLDALLAHAVDIVAAPSFSTYPVGKADVALVVDSGTAAADVESALRDGAGPLLESVHLFDVFAGEQIGPGQKSLAYSLRFRASDRTLTEAEIKQATDAAVAAAAARVGAIQRT
ncbi:MAG: phenylalanine--tRNA ligase subunit beta [Nocardioidaceae bacterium]